jgi:hypothetical protein
MSLECERGPVLGVEIRGTLRRDEFDPDLRPVARGAGTANGDAVRRERV